LLWTSKSIKKAKVLIFFLTTTVQQKIGFDAIGICPLAQKMMSFRQSENIIVL